MDVFHKPLRSRFFDTLLGTLAPPATAFRDVSPCLLAFHYNGGLNTHYNEGLAGRSLKALIMVYSHVFSLASSSAFP
jgi:hypothetical protein